MTLIKKLSRNIGVWFTLWVLWMGAIFFFSSIPGSSVYYEPPLLLLIERKGAHVVEYALLFLLSLQFFSLLYSKETLRKLLAIAFLWTLAYAISDELHQFFTPFRGAKIKDVFIDTGGILLAFIPILFMLIRRRK